MGGRALLLGVVAAAATACGPSEVVVDTGLDGLALASVQPARLVPGSRIVLRGRSFIGADYGTSRLRLRGRFGGASVDVALSATFIDYDEMWVSWPGGRAAGLPGDAGVFDGEAIVEVDSSLDGARHESEPLSLRLDVASALEPRLLSLHQGVIFVNEPIVVEGDGFLLGGDEGTTFARVEGCFAPVGQTTCLPTSPREVPLTPETPFDRTRGTFPFDPRIAGIRPGSFTGTVTLVNRHGDAAGRIERGGAPESADYELVPPAIFGIQPTAASLGQYVNVTGGGFVGARPGDPDATLLVTTLELEGTFTPDGGASVPVEVSLVPEFVSGPRVRYVLNEEDDLGQRVDLRRTTGVFVGTVRPTVHYGSDSVVGDPKAVTLSIAPVKQVVWLNFLPSYVESLRHFGLRALEDRIRARILEVARRDYEGVNIEFRTEPPEDFALYAQVDIAGPDPNGLGLLGYDNTPGKDVGNVRLYDKIGGVNALTQEGGYPGYGGVFVESFFGFSMHPGSLAHRIEGADPLFDRIFDPFRPDVGGRPVLAADLAGGIPTLDSAAGCPAESGNRAMQAACAAFVLGSLIGTTMTHEVGHSLGLANPYGEGFHNVGDQPNRLMDAGSARTFTERAELSGDGPAVFCEEEFEYLREILPSDVPPPAVARPTCGP